MRLATHSNFKEFVKASGLEFYPLGGDPKVLAGCKEPYTCVDDLFTRLWIYIAWNDEVTSMYLYFF